LDTGIDNVRRLLGIARKIKDASFDENDGATEGDGCHGFVGTGGIAQTDIGRGHETIGLGIGPDAVLRVGSERFGVGAIAMKGGDGIQSHKVQRQEKG
jgi:hypothetical protein